MAPIALPHPIPAGIPAPHEIQDKPTLDDLKSTMNYRDRVNVQYRSMKTATSPDDMIRAEVYVQRVMAAYISDGDAVPLAGEALHNALQAALQPLNNQIADLATQVGNLATQFTNLDRRLIRVHQTALRISNRQCNDGIGENYQIVPFNDGSDPVENHDLPALIDLQSIRDLSAQQCTAFCKGYGVAPVPQALADKHKAVARSVGGIM